jgi:hypothetical protein
VEQRVAKEYFLINVYPNVAKNLNFKVVIPADIMQESKFSERLDAVRDFGHDGRNEGRRDKSFSSMPFAPCTTPLSGYIYCLKFDRISHVRS